MLQRLIHLPEPEHKSANGISLEHPFSLALLQCRKPVLCGFVDANECLRTLLLLDVDDIRALDWYRGKLFSCLTNEEDYLKIVLEAKNQFVRSSAIYHIEKTEYLKKILELPNVPLDLKIDAVKRIQDIDILDIMAADEALSIKLRTVAVKRVKNQELLSKIVWSKDDSDIRVAATMNITDKKELERIRDEADDSRIRRCACGRLRHKWGFAPWQRWKRRSVYM